MVAFFFIAKNILGAWFFEVFCYAAFVNVIRYNSMPTCSLLSLFFPEKFIPFPALLFCRAPYFAGPFTCMKRC